MDKRRPFAKGEAMNDLQKVENGGLVMVAGYEMTVSDMREVLKDGCPCIEFKGTCTES